MYKVLISAPYLLNDIKLFKEELSSKGIEIDIYPVEERLEEADLLPVIAQYHGVICGDDRFTPNVIDAAHNLKVIVKWGTGIDSIDKVYANSKGVQVRNTLNAFTEPVSDSVLALMLAFTRKIFESDRIMKSGNWEKAFGVSMSEVSLGLIGLGNIGKAVARKIKAFGTKVYVTDILPIDSALAKDLSIEVVSLDELLSNSDFVSVCCDLNKSSHHLLDAKAFAKMKPKSYVINTARGPIIHEKSLIDALKSGKLAGAGLDVFEDEPLAIDSPLRKMDQVILSSHNVNASPFHWNRVHRNSLNMLYESLGI